MVADALNRKAQHSLNTVVITQLSLLRETGDLLSLLRETEDLGVQLVQRGQAIVQLLALTLQPSIVNQIRVNGKRP